MNYKAYLSVILLSAAAASSAARSPSETYLACDMEGRTIALGYSEQTARIFDVRYPRVAFWEAQVTQTHLSFSVKNPFYANDYFNGWKGEKGAPKAYSVEGSINRVTGEGGLFFYAEHNATTIAACHKTNSGPWCSDPILIGSKVGSCRQVDRKF